MTVPRGQSEAARALGLGTVPLVLRVVMPQLVRFALPGYANVWQVLVKSTAVVSVIGLADLVGPRPAGGAVHARALPVLRRRARLLPLHHLGLDDDLRAGSGATPWAMRVDLVLANWQIFAQGSG
jgi:hypothetical protein